MSNEWEPVLTVEIEPDYWSGGHSYEGTKPWINPTKVWALPIGTKLYTTPASATAQAVPRVEVCCLKFDTCRNQCVPLVDHLRGQIKELKAAPAVPQGLERYEPTVMVEESRGRLTATGAVMKPKEDGRWVRLRDLTATPAPAPAQEVGLTDDERADMACAVAAICTGASSRTVAATAIEWTERALRAKESK